MQQHKSNRESALLSMGFELQSGVGGGVDLLHVVQSDTSLAFSGYGAFTPITVRAETVLENADMERNQR